MDSRYLDIVRLLIDSAPFVFTQKCFALKGGTALNLFGYSESSVEKSVWLGGLKNKCPC